MDPNQTTMLLSSIDHTLASARAALAAGADREQTQEARSQLSAKAGADVARLVASSRDQGWNDVPAEVSAALERAADAAGGGDLQAAERQLRAAREALGGPSR